MRQSSRHQASRNWDIQNTTKLDEPDAIKPDLAQLRINAGEAYQRLDRHLEMAIAELKSKGNYNMRGFERLSTLGEDLFADLDNKCNAVCDRIVAAKQKGAAVVQQFEVLANDVEQKAEAAENVLRRLSNMPNPTNGSQEPQG